MVTGEVDIGDLSEWSEWSGQTAPVFEEPAFSNAKKD